MTPASVSLLGALGAFAAGLLSFLSPCVLPLTPAYVARLVGPAVWESGTLDRSGRAALRAATTRHAAAFVGGFTTAFIALGATASQLGAFLSDHAPQLRQIGGLILILFGVYIAGAVQLPFLSRERRFTVRTVETSYPASYLIGIVFALGWTPCIGPVLAGILVLAAQAHTLSGGVLLLAVYSLGLGVPFLALGVAFDRLTPALKRLTPHMRTVELITGGLLILMGIVIFFNWLFFLNSRFALPGLG
jgi:cytochrome c-type biogenesis protein